MSARYSIMVRQYQSDREVELCSCATNPEMIAEAARAKKLLIAGKGSRRISVPKYEHVYIVDHEKHGEEQ